MKFKKMNSCRFILFLFLFIHVFLFSSCANSQGVVTFEDIKSGKHLDKAKEIELDTFLVIWTSNVKNSKIPKNIEELFQDSLYTYFGIMVTKNSHYYKVKNDRLKILDYKSIDGDEIRNKFYENVISFDAKENISKCSNGYSETKEYTYRYIEPDNSIEVKCKYKVSCNGLIRKFKKDYIAIYKIESKTFKTN